MTQAEIANIADVDARENWQVMVAFRDRLIANRTIEAAYLDMMRGAGKAPHIFINQLVHVILRNALDDCGDPFVLRAAEMFFRPQRMTQHEGSLIAADEEMIAGKSETPVSPLVSMLGIPPEAEIDIINDDNADHYFAHSDQFHMAIDLTAGRRGLAALGTVIERWVEHLLSVEVDVEPLIEVRDVNLTWYVGLDAEATRIGDALWNGEELDEAAQQRVVGLYPFDVPRSRRGARQGQGRAGVPDPGDGQGQDAAHQAAESADRPADQASGGGDVSVLVRIPVGVVVERRKAMSQWTDYRLAAGRGAARRARHRAVDRAQARGRPHLVLRRPAIIEFHTTETSHYRDNLAAAPSFGWCCGRPKPRAGLPGRARHRRSVRGRRLHRGRQRHRRAVPMPDVDPRGA